MRACRRLHFADDRTWAKNSLSEGAICSKGPGGSGPTSRRPAHQECRPCVLARSSAFCPSATKASTLCNKQRWPAKRPSCREVSHQSMSHLVLDRAPSGAQSSLLAKNAPCADQYHAQPPVPLERMPLHGRSRARVCLRNGEHC